MNKFVRSLDGDYMTAAEAASLLGLTARQLWELGRKHPETLGPGYVTKYGNRTIYLYTAEDIAMCEQWREEHGGFFEPRPGRPQVWTLEEAADRKRRQMRARYYESKAAKLAKEGDEAGAAAASTKSKEIRDSLQVEAERRQSEIDRS